MCVCLSKEGGLRRDRVFRGRPGANRDLKIPRYRCTGTGSVPLHVKFSCA